MPVRPGRFYPRAGISHSSGDVQSHQEILPEDHAGNAEIRIVDVQSGPGEDGAFIELCRSKLKRVA